MKFRMLLSALLLAACVVCVPGCKKAPKKAEKKAATPAEVSSAFLKAVVDGDQEAAAKQCTGSFAPTFVAAMIEGLKEKSNADPNSAAVLNALKNAKFDEKIDGDKAVTIMIGPDGSKGGFSFLLKKVDGEWKIDTDAVLEEANKSKKSKKRVRK